MSVFPPFPTLERDMAPSCYPLGVRFFLSPSLQIRYDERQTDQ